jgi:hypothetical protein
VNIFRQLFRYNYCKCWVVLNFEHLEKFRRCYIHYCFNLNQKSLLLSVRWLVLWFFFHSATLWLVQLMCTNTHTHTHTVKKHTHTHRRTHYDISTFVTHTHTYTYTHPHTQLLWQTLVIPSATCVAPFNQKFGNK